MTQEIEAKDGSRISHLSDDILCFIISLLSLREAFRARLLSRRWRYLSPETSNLFFDSFTVLGQRISKSILDQSRRKEFVARVAQCLMHLKVPKLISLQVRFCLWKDNASDIDEWISLATVMDVRKIDLNFKYVPEGVELYSFPFHLLLPASHLEHLCLRSCILRPSPDSTDRLSSLKSLHLASVPLNESDVEIIVSSCLKLEHFILRQCHLPNKFCVRGKLHHLKSLVLENNSISWNIEIHDLFHLKEFEYLGRWPANFSIRGLPCLKRLHLMQTYLNRKLVYDAIPKAVPHLQHLSLTFLTTKGASVLGNITKFSCVRQIDLYLLVSSDFNLLSLVYILNAVPVLQKLLISLFEGLKRGQENLLHMTSKFILNLKKSK